MVKYDNMKKYIYAGMVSVGAAMLPLFTSAQEIFPVASSTEAINSGYAALGVLVLLVVGAVIIAWASLVGLGFGIRKAVRYVTGRKF